MEIATTKLSSRGQIVIPLEMRKDMKEGENLVIIKQGDNFLIKKEESVLADWSDVKVFADDKLLEEAWGSPEDEKAFAYLQEK
ncbi:MAG: AbrB/MazE/SpoVT family DNA-binding domain-containing protein [archaeon]|nr:AbrB/MazE/SpoVT family DNA-binding domain-containing protein [archaeon]